MVTKLKVGIARVGHNVIEGLWHLGAGARLFANVLMNLGECLKRPSLIVKEIFSTGVLSLLIILVSAFFVGMVLGLQGYNTLQRYGSSEAIGVLVALSLVRELGPVVTALLFAGRAGTAITAEIGLMRATEQLSAMEMMAVSPVARVLAPRFMAGIIAMPILAALFSMVGILGGYFVAVPLIGVDSGAFWSQMQASVDFREDVINGVIKSLVFGVVCTMIALFEGYDAPPTAEGVSRATTRTVVYSSLAVLGMDFILTAFMINV
jgi:phospholipid/cholesterol/gamma-HCH transport system permease protein